MPGSSTKGILATSILGVALAAGTVPAVAANASDTAEDKLESLEYPGNSQSALSKSAPPAKKKAPPKKKKAPPKKKK